MINTRIQDGRAANLRFKLSFVILLAILVFNCYGVNAQIPKDLPTAKTGTVNAGSLLTQFVGAINPSSFTDQWEGEKSSWLASASKIVSAPGLAENVSSLAKMIKPSMFKEAFKVENLLQTATKAKTMAQAAGLLKNLEGGLKPEAMVSGWAGKKSAWLNALNLLK